MGAKALKTGLCRAKSYSMGNMCLTAPRNCTMQLTPTKKTDFEAELEEQRSRNYEFWSDYCEEKYYAEVGGNDD